MMSDDTACIIGSSGSDMTIIRANHWSTNHRWLYEMTVRDGVMVYRAYSDEEMAWFRRPWT